MSFRSFQNRDDRGFAGASGWSGRASPVAGTGGGRLCDPGHGADPDGGRQWQGRVGFTLQISSEILGLVLERHVQEARSDCCRSVAAGIARRYPPSSGSPGRSGPGTAPNPLPGARHGSPWNVPRQSSNKPNTKPGAGANCSINRSFPPKTLEQFEQAETLARNSVAAARLEVNVVGARRTGRVAAARNA